MGVLETVVIMAIIISIAEPLSILVRKLYNSDSGEGSTSEDCIAAPDNYFMRELSKEGYDRFMSCELNMSHSAMSHQQCAWVLFVGDPVEFKKLMSLEERSRKLSISFRIYHAISKLEYSSLKDTDSETETFMTGAGVCNKGVIHFQLNEGEVPPTQEYRNQFLNKGNRITPLTNDGTHEGVYERRD